MSTVISVFHASVSIDFRQKMERGRRSNAHLFKVYVMNSVLEILERSTPIHSKLK